MWILLWLRSKRLPGSLKLLLETRLLSQGKQHTCFIILLSFDDWLIITNIAHSVSAHWTGQQALCKYLFIIDSLQEIHWVEVMKNNITVLLGISDCAIVRSSWTITFRSYIKRAYTLPYARYCNLFNDFLVGHEKVIVIV